MSSGKDEYAIGFISGLLNRKNEEIGHLKRVCQHQERLLSFVHAEKNAQTKKIDALLTKAAEDSNKLADNDETIRKLEIENASLKRQAQAFKDEMEAQKVLLQDKLMSSELQFQMENTTLKRQMDERKDSMEAQRVLLQGKLMFSELKGSKLEDKCVFLEQEIAVMQETMETQIKAAVQDMQAQTEEVKAGTLEMETQTVTGYVAFAADQTNDWVLRACAISYVVRSELRDVLNEAARFEASLDDQEFEIYQEQTAELASFLPKVEVTQAVETIEAAPEAAVAQKAKKANKKKKAPKETPEEKAAREEAERKAHDESARLKKQQERREEAKKTADRKAKIHALRAKKEQEVRDEAMQAKTAEPRAAIQPNPAALVKYTDSLRAMGNLHDFVGPYDA